MRIELGEIEWALATHADVQEAVVQSRDGQLLAWFIPCQAVDIETLRTHLQNCIERTTCCQRPTCPWTRGP